MHIGPPIARIRDLKWAKRMRPLRQREDRVREVVVHLQAGDAGEERLPVEIDDREVGFGPVEVDVLLGAGEAGIVVDVGLMEVELCEDLEAVFEGELCLDSLAEDKSLRSGQELEVVHVD